MEKVTAEQLKRRWDEAPDVVREALFGTATNDQFDQIAIHFHLSDDKKESLSQLCVLVFLGFLHFDELFKEIRDTLKIDSRVALDIYHELDKKLFDSFRKEIEDNFIKHKIGAIKESEVVQPKPIEPQVVLKEQEGPEVINLRQETVPVSEPVKLKVTGESRASKEVSSTESGQAPPVAMSAVSRPTVTKPEAEKISEQPTTQKSEQKPMPEGPVILHKKEEAPAVAQAQATSAFKQTSFGGFFGSFKTMEEQKPKDVVSSAQIEMPVDLLNKKSEEEVAQKIPVVVKKYEEPAKTIHYSDFRTSLEKTSDGQLKPVTAKPTALSPVQSKPEPKKGNGEGIVDLASLTIKNK